MTTDGVRSMTLIYQKEGLFNILLVYFKVLTVFKFVTQFLNFIAKSKVSK